MKKAVFFDIDGTIWNDRMQIPDSTKASIRALREAGNYAFLCSGRSRANIRAKELMGIGFDGVIAACGAHIDFHGEMAFEQLLSKEQVTYALAVIKKNHMLAVLEGPRYIYVDADDFCDDPYVSYLKKELREDVKPIAGNTEFEINKLSIDLKGADLKLVLEELEEEFDVIVHDDWLIEILPKGYSKATGIRKVCEMLDIAMEDTYAFGDSANDLEMLAFVAHGIAMGNGTSEAKQAAEFVTTDIMEDGVQVGLKHYGLI